MESVPSQFSGIPAPHWAHLPFYCVLKGVISPVYLSIALAVCHCTNQINMMVLYFLWGKSRIDGLCKFRKWFPDFLWTHKASSVCAGWLSLLKLCYLYGATQPLAGEL